jgi:predicted methyltransferase
MRLIFLGPFAFPYYRALKPGGILRITDHRADPSQPQDPNAENGYVCQDYMIQLAEQEDSS